MLASTSLRLGAIPSSITRTPATLLALRRASSSCLQPSPSRLHLSYLATRTTSSLSKPFIPAQPRTRLLSSTPHLPFPRTQPAIRKPDSATSNSASESPSFLSELAKEEQDTFAADAARFRAQTGMSSRGLGRGHGHDHHSRLDAKTHGQGLGTSEGSSSSSRAGPQPRFREEILKEDPTFEQPKFEEGIGRPGIWKQIAFVGLATVAIYGNAAEYTNFDTKRLSAVFPSPFMVTSEQLRRVRLGIISEKLKKTLQKLKDSMSGLPNSISYPFLWSYVQLANGYINASEGKRIAYQICAINGVIWLLWQFRVLKPFMNANFTHHPLSGRVITLLTCIFSHESFIHLAFNSFALISFGSAATAYLTKKQQMNSEGVLESTPKYHFWAMFITAGLFSSLVSHVVSARLFFPRLLAEARASKVADDLAHSTGTAFRRLGSAAKGKARSGSPKDILPSLGASGAIYATVTMTALAYPDAQVFLLFPPIPLPITWGVGGLVLMDLIGVIKGWRMFDHWAHLSGAAFGVLYYRYGSDFWNWLRASYARRIQNQPGKS
ncbi:hypothetical protein ACEPAF_712 [Sanghuangporus sanghuang]